MLKEAAIAAVAGTAVTNLLIVPLDVIIAGKAMPETWVSYALGLLSLIILAFFIGCDRVEKAEKKAYKAGYARGYKDSSQASYWKHEGRAEKVIERVLNGEEQE